MNLTRPVIIGLVQADLAGNKYGKKYKKTIIKHITHFLDWKGNRTLPDITQKDIREYQEALLDIVSDTTGKPLAANSLNDRYNAVRYLFSVLYKAGILQTAYSGEFRPVVPETSGRFLETFGRKADIKKTIQPNKISVNHESGFCESFFSIRRDCPFSSKRSAL